MSEPNQPPKTDRRQYTFNMLLTAAAGMAGCLTVAILFIALFAGLWLDSRLNSPNHLYTIGLMLLSIPFTIGAMLWVVRVTTSRIKPSAKAENHQEDADRGTTET